MSTTYSKGRYLVEILGQGFENAPTGTDRFFLHVKVLGRYDGSGQIQGCPQNQRTYRQSLANETGASLLIADLKAIHVPLTDLSMLHPGTQGYLNLAGKKIDMICDVEVFENKDIERWRIRGNKPLNLENVQALQSKFCHLFRGDAQQEPAASAAEIDEEVVV